MQRAKKPKKSPIHKPAKSPLDIVKTCNYLSLAIIVRCLWDCYGWRNKRITQFVEAYLALLNEVVDKRNSIEGMIRDTKERTGIDVRKLIDELYR